MRVTRSTDSVFLDAKNDLYTLNDDFYTYTAKLSEGYILEENVILPTISINIFSKKVEQSITTNVKNNEWNYDTNTNKLTIKTQAGVVDWNRVGKPNNLNLTSGILEKI